MSKPVDKKTCDGVSEVIDFDKDSHLLSWSVEGGQMVEVAGVEPASLVLSYGASTCLVSGLLSSEERPQTGYPRSRSSKIRPKIENHLFSYTY